LLLDRKLHHQLKKTDNSSPFRQFQPEYACPERGKELSSNRRFIILAENHIGKIPPIRDAMDRLRGE
jgi:hypothetical protein